MKNSSRPGIGILGILQIVFITLKLTDNLDWNWFWILSPTLLPIGFVLGAGLIYGLIILLLIGLGVKTYEEVLKKMDKNEKK